MSRFDHLKARLLEGESVPAEEFDRLRDELTRGKQLDREAVESLAAIRRTLPTKNPSLDRLFFELVRQHLLADESISQEETLWLVRILFDGEVGSEEQRLLLELHTSARRVCAEFQQLLDNVVLR